MENKYILTSEGELCHYGVPGMKWGQRKAVKYEAKAQRFRNRGRINAANKFQSKADAIHDTQKAKLEKFVGKKYAKAGIQKGYEKYERSQGDAAYKKHDSTAKAMEKSAGQLEKEGKFLRAEALRKSASAVRSRGANIRNERYAAADEYMKKADRITEKVSAYASKNRVNLGKSKIDSIMKKSIQKGMDRSKDFEEYNRQSEIEERYGSDALNAYKYATGRS